MARKIVVVGENRDIKKTIALTLVCNAIADWVVKNVSIKMRPVREYKPATAPKAYQPPPRIYIPDYLPPLEIGGVYFKGPKPQLTACPLSALMESR